MKSFFETDSYDRSLSDHFDAIEMKDDTSRWRFYEVERIMNKRFRKYDNLKVAQYLFKWKDWRPEWDEWRNIIKLNNCLKLVEEYEKRQRVEQRFKDKHRLIFIKKRRRRASTSSNTFFKQTFINSIVRINFSSHFMKTSNKRMRRHSKKYI